MHRRSLLQTAIAAFGVGALRLPAAWALAPAPAEAADAVPAGDRVIRAHGISIFGEPRLPADFPHLPYVNPDAPKGGEISEAIPNSSNFDNLNPFSDQGRPAALAAVALESLLAGDASDFGAAYGLLAEWLEYPEHRDWVIFSIRPEAKFSDGTPVTAHDVVFTYETLRDKARIAIRTLIMQQVAKVDALDDRRVRFYFTKGYPRREVIQFVGGLGIFSRKDFMDNKRDLAAPMNTPMIGSGPYVLGSVSMGRTVAATRRPDYWGEGLPISRGRYNFDRIRFEYFADYDTAYRSFEVGEYTFRREVKSLLWATGYKFAAMEKGWVRREALPDGSPVNGQAWVFNLRRPKFQDARLREAIGLMFNFHWTNATLFYGLYKRVNSFWENTPLAAQGKPSPEELALLEPLAQHIPPEVLTEDAWLWPEGTAQQLDRAMVRRVTALLEEAGWKSVAGDPIRRNAKGEPLRVEFMNDGPDQDRILDPYIENLRRVGIDAVNLRVDNSEQVARIRSHDFDLTSDFLGQTPIPGAEMRPVFGSEFAGTDSNLSGLANPAVDSLMRTVESAQDEATMLTAVHALDRVLRAIKLCVPQWYTPNHLIAYYDMFGHPSELPPYALGELDFWWYDADKAEKLKQAGALR